MKVIPDSWIEEAFHKASLSLPESVDLTGRAVLHSWFRAGVRWAEETYRDQASPTGKKAGVIVNRTGGPIRDD